MLYSHGRSEDVWLARGFRGEGARPGLCVLSIELPQLLCAHQRAAQMFLFSFYLAIKRPHLEFLSGVSQVKQDGAVLA